MSALPATRQAKGFSMKSGHDVSEIKTWIEKADSVVVLTGAGVSTDSGIPDFRSAAGIYADSRNNEVFDLSAFTRDPSGFYRFAQTFYPQVYRARPNVAHTVPLTWQGEGRILTTVTQNVDDCHQRAGASPVHTLHGSVRTSQCLACRQSVLTETLLPCIARGDSPVCSCGGVFKPDIVFFGEMLPEDAWNASAQAIQHADVLVVLGTSLNVYPAASLPAYRHQTTRLVIINRDATPLDGQADAVIHDDLSAVMPSLVL